MGDNNFDLKGFLNDPQVQANKSAAIQYLQGKGIINIQGNVITPLAKQENTSLPLSESAVLPSQGMGESTLLGDTMKTGANALGDVWNLLKGMTYGTATNLLKIPAEAGALAYETATGKNAGVSNAIANFAKAIPQETAKTLWGFVPQSTKELANTQAISQIPKEFQQLAKESGGYANAFSDLVKSLPEGFAKTDAINELLTHIDRARQAGINHPVYEALGYLGMKQLIENPQAFAQNTAQAGKSTAEFLKSPIESTKGAIQNTGQILNKIIQPLGDKFINQEKDAWTKPVNIAKPAFNKATDIYKNALSQGNDIANTLINDKIQFSDHIQGGNYVTGDTADAIRADAGQMQKDMLRPALKLVDYSIPRTSVEDVITGAEQSIKANKFIPSETQNSLIGKLGEVKSALSEKYPQGLTLTDLLDEKILRDFNSKYNPLGDIGTTQEALKNKAVADASRRLLDAKAPPELGIQNFQAELQKQYQAADYLDALNNKKAPISIYSRLAKTTAKVIGATIGYHLEGGIGILGGVGGYHIGGMLETALEGLPNPLKVQFLNNLEKTNPPAFQAVKNFIGETNMARLQQKALPPPNFIPLKEKVRNSSMEVLPAQKYPVSINPKTGKFRTMYKSIPKNPLP